MNTRVWIDSWFRLLRLLRRHRAGMMILLARQRAAGWCRLMMVMMMTRLYCGGVTVHYLVGAPSARASPRLRSPDNERKLLFAFLMWFVNASFCLVFLFLFFRALCKKSTTPISFLSSSHKRIHKSRKRTRTWKWEALQMIRHRITTFCEGNSSAQHSATCWLYTLLL